MKSLVKKCLNKCAHIPVHITGGTGSAMEFTGEIIWRSGTYIREKSDDVHEWIDETIEIGKEELNNK